MLAKIWIARPEDDARTPVEELPLEDPPRPLQIRVVIQAQRVSPFGGLALDIRHAGRSVLPRGRGVHLELSALKPVGPDREARLEVLMDLALSEAGEHELVLDTSPPSGPAPIATATFRVVAAPGAAR